MKDEYRNNPVDLKDIVTTEKYKNTYTTFPVDVNDPLTIEEAVGKLASYFDFLENQIIMIGMRDNRGDIRYEYPAIITKVHTPNINGHNTYDYVTFVRGNCEFISTQSETERYAWRFCTKSNIPNWVLELISKWGEVDISDEDEPITIDKLVMIENDELHYPFKNTKEINDTH